MISSACFPHMLIGSFLPHTPNRILQKPSNSTTRVIPSKQVVLSSWKREKIYAAPCSKFWPKTKEEWSVMVDG